ncbi:MAG: hypothetical protein U0T83_08140 [Bacteriovoracaceae bacterium]
MNDNVFKKCSTCKKDILYNKPYQLCSVSTCNKSSNPHFFCSVTCWDVHVPIMNHKTAYAEEHVATPASNRRYVVPNASNKSEVNNDDSGDALNDILIVESKLKNYIKEKSGGFQTSGNVKERLSRLVRELCNDAIDSARADGRKTVMDRDFIDNIIK